MNIKLILIIIMMCAHGYAAENYLRDVESRLLYGPLDVVGMKLLIPDGTFEVSQPAADEIKTSEILRSILVPACDFTNASIADVGAFFARVCATNGVIFRVDTNAVTIQCAPVCVLSMDNYVKSQLFTISVRYMSVFNLLHIISRSFALPIGVDGAVVTIGAALTKEEMNVARQAAIRRIARESGHGNAKGGVGTGNQ